MVWRKNKEMLTVRSKTLSCMMKDTISEVRAAYISRVHYEKGRIAEWRELLLSSGFVECSDCDIVDAGDKLYTTDGRIVIRAAGSVWAITIEQHKAMVATGIRRGIHRDQEMQKKDQSATCTTLIDGQLCGGSLIMSSVCPRCALGKSGIAATLTCDVCGHVTAIMRGDK